MQKRMQDLLQRISRGCSREGRFKAAVRRRSTLERQVLSAYRADVTAAQQAPATARSTRLKPTPARSFPRPRGRSCPHCGRGPGLSRADDPGSRVARPPDTTQIYQQYKKKLARRHSGSGCISRRWSGCLALWTRRSSIRTRQAPPVPYIACSTRCSRQDRDASAK